MPLGRKFVCRELAESPGAAARIADGDQEAAMMRNYVMRSRMYRARRVAGGGCLVLSPATTNAGGCVSRAARVHLHDEEFQRNLDAALEAAAAGVEPASPNEFATIYRLRAV